MELALTAIAGIGGTTAGTAAAVAGGTAAATAGSTAFNILAGVATAGTVLGTLISGFEEARQSDDLAAEAIVDAGQQQLRSTERQNQLRRELMRVLGENDVAAAAAGIDVSGGIAASQRRTANEDASRALSIERRDDELMRARLRARAAGLERRATGQRIGALVDAATQVAKFGMNVGARG